MTHELSPEGIPEQNVSKDTKENYFIQTLYNRFLKKTGGGPYHKQWRIWYPNCTPDTVVMKCKVKNGEVMLSDPVKGFPSDHLLAQMVLLF